MSWKCPNCEEEISALSYSVDTTGREYGMADIRNTRPIGPNEDIIRDHDCSDQNNGEWSGEVEYECPECNDAINPNDLVWIDDEAKQPKAEIIKKVEDEEVEHNIIHPEQNIQSNRNLTGKASDSSLICKNCRHIIVTDTDGCCGALEERFYECPECNYINSSTEFRELLKSGFFKEQANVNKHPK